METCAAFPVTEPPLMPLDVVHIFAHQRPAVSAWDINPQARIWDSVCLRRATSTAEYLPPRCRAQPLRQELPTVATTSFNSPVGLSPDRHTFNDLSVAAWLGIAAGTTRCGVPRIHPVCCQSAVLSPMAFMTQSDAVAQFRPQLRVIPERTDMMSVQLYAGRPALLTCCHVARDDCLRPFGDGFSAIPAAAGRIIQGMLRTSDNPSTLQPALSRAEPPSNKRGCPRLFRAVLLSAPSAYLDPLDIEPIAAQWTAIRLI